MTEIHSIAAAVPTTNGSRYLQQLCRHWAHNLAVEFTPERGTVVFPRDARGAEWPGDAIITMTARDGILDCRIEASAPDQLEGLKGALARHLDRFAFREAPLAFNWRDSNLVQPPRLDLNPTCEAFPRTASRQDAAGSGESACRSSTGIMGGKV